MIKHFDNSTKDQQQSLAMSYLYISGLYFIFDGEKFVLKNEKMHGVDIAETVKSILNLFNLVNRKGFSPSIDPNPVIPSFYSFLTTSGYKMKEYGFGFNERTYRLWYSFLLINLSLLISKELQSNPDKEHKLYLKGLNTNLLSRLEPYIRIQLQNRGISIIQNTYTGFDTEYELVNYKKSLNKLISVQLAIKTRTLVKIPLYSVQNISYVHPLTSEITNYYKPKTID